MLIETKYFSCNDSFIHNGFKPKEPPNWVDFGRFFHRPMSINEPTNNQHFFFQSTR